MYELLGGLARDSQFSVKAEVNTLKRGREYVGIS